MATNENAPAVATAEARIQNSEASIVHGLEWHVTQICESWRDSVGSIIETGRRVRAALNELPHGEKSALWERLPFKKSTFWQPGKEGGAALQGQAVLYFGDDVRAFRAAFGPLGTVLGVLK